MKNIFITLLLTLCLSYSKGQSNEAPYRIFGEITTVQNQTYKGFITWGGMKNHWIDLFTASKMNNPYSRYFNEDDGVVFYSNGQAFAKPPSHIFCCRFGNLSSILLTGENEIQLELKNGEKMTVVKGSPSDINTSIQITTAEGSIRLKWEYISEIRFMEADNNIQPENSSVAGIAKTKQGVYKGLITWNSNKRRNKEKNDAINTFLNKMEKIVQDRKIFKVLPKDHSFKNPIAIKSELLYPVENVMVNMPNIGSVTIPAAQLEEIEIIPVSELSLLSYNDFPAPQKITGEVNTRNGEQVTGNLAYDLDESLNIEILDGKNDNINYQIPFKYIRSIEPKNYKYSYITLISGSHLSLGEGADVSRENSGIIILGSNELPIYIQWNEVKSILFK